MKKGLQKILLLIAVLTVTGHCILPHLHHEEIQGVVQQPHHDEPPAGQHHEDDTSKNTKHSLFSFVQLDEDFIPVKGQNKSFELPLIFLPALIVTYLSENFSANTKTHFGWYKEYPPPKKSFLPFSHRGPPTV